MKKILLILLIAFLPNLLAFSQNEGYFDFTKNQEFFHFSEKITHKTNSKDNLSKIATYDTKNLDIYFVFTFDEVYKFVANVVDSITNPIPKIYQNLK